MTNGSIPTIQLSENIQQKAVTRLFIYLTMIELVSACPIYSWIKLLNQWQVPTVKSCPCHIQWSVSTSHGTDHTGGNQISYNQSEKWTKFTKYYLWFIHNDKMCLPVNDVIIVTKTTNETLYIKKHQLPSCWRVSEALTGQGCQCLVTGRFHFEQWIEYSTRVQSKD